MHVLFLGVPVAARRILSCFALLRSHADALNMSLTHYRRQVNGEEVTEKCKKYEQINLGVKKEKKKLQRKAITTGNSWLKSA